MKKRPYRSTEIKDVDQEMLADRFPHQKLTVGVDAAKEKMLACVMGPHWDNYYVFDFNRIDEMDRFVDLLDGLPADEIEVVFEPSGSYSDSLRSSVEKANFEARKLEPDKCGKADDLFDDVPSMHDGKAAYLISRLHLQQVSKEWKTLSDERRAMKIQLRRLQRLDARMNQLTGQLEASLARHWPEVTSLISLTSASLLELLKATGGPLGVEEAPEKAAELLRRVSRGQLSADKIALIVGSAAETTGVPPIDEEIEELKELAAEMREVQARMSTIEKKLEQLTEQDEAAGNIEAFAGLKVAVSLVALLGEPADYGCANQYQKAAGLNVKERSSGKHKGELRITKRGPGVVRKYLYMLACRMIQQERGCPYVTAWYHERLRRNGGCKLKGLVAVMRKLIKAIYHIGQGEAYDPTKLFDVSRLELQPVLD